MSELLSFILEQFRRSVRQFASDEDRGVYVLIRAIEHVCHRFTLTSLFNATPTPMDLQQTRPPGWSRLPKLRELA